MRRPSWREECAQVCLTCAITSLTALDLNPNLDPNLNLDLNLNLDPGGANLMGAILANQRLEL